MNEKCDYSEERLKNDSDLLDCTKEVGIHGDNNLPLNKFRFFRNLLNK